MIDVGASERNRAVAGRFIDLDLDPMPALVVLSPDGAVRVAATGRQLPPHGELGAGEAAAILTRWASAVQ